MAKKQTDVQLKEQKEQRKEKDKKFLTLLILFVPTIILVTISNLEESLTKMVLQLLVAFYQLIVMKNLLDAYYGTG